MGPSRSAQLILTRPPGWRARKAREPSTGLCAGPPSTSKQTRPLAGMYHSTLAKSLREAELASASLESLAFARVSLEAPVRVVDAAQMSTCSHGRLAGWKRRKQKWQTQREFQRRASQLFLVIKGIQWT